MSRRGARLYHTIGNRDRNEKPITQTLEARGYAVTQLRGRGVPDLLVSKHGCMWLVEIKQPKGTYTPAQLAWRASWTGPAVATLRSVEEALAFPAPAPVVAPRAANAVVGLFDEGEGRLPDAGRTIAEEHNGKIRLV